MKKLVKEEELLIKVEYGHAYCSLIPMEKPQQHEELVELGLKTKLQWRRELHTMHRSGRRTHFTVPEPFKNLLIGKTKGSSGRVPVEFAMATYRYEEPREVFNILYAIAITHKLDKFSRKVAREIVTGRIRRYLKDKYEKYQGIFFTSAIMLPSRQEYPNPYPQWDKERPDFIHVEIDTPKGVIV